MSVAQDLDDFDLRQRLSRGSAHTFVRQDRHLAEHLPRPEDGQQHGIATFATAPDPDSPADQHVHRVAGLALVVQVGLRGELQMTAASLERRALALGQRGEESNGLGDAPKIHEHAQLRVPTRTGAWLAKPVRVVSFTHEDERNT